MTTTSTLAGHWDGDAREERLALEGRRNNNMAKQALGLTMGVYSKNIAMSTAATPTPHWVAFTMFHVERDLAKGLYLQNVKR